VIQENQSPQIYAGSIGGVPLTNDIMRGGDGVAWRIEPVPGPQGQPIAFQLPVWVQVQGGPVAEIAVMSTGWNLGPFKALQFLNKDPSGTPGTAWWNITILQAADLQNQPMGKSFPDPITPVVSLASGFAYDPGTGLYGSPSIANPTAKETLVDAQPVPSPNPLSIGNSPYIVGLARVRIDMAFSNNTGSAQTVTVAVFDQSDDDVGTQGTFTVVVPTGATFGSNNPYVVRYIFGTAENTFEMGGPGSSSPPTLTSPFVLSMDSNPVGIVQVKMATATSGSVDVLTSFVRY
jgi:hypothetical protein